MEQLLRHIGVVSNSVYSFIAYILVIFAWVYVATKEKKLKIIAGVIKELPEEDRKAVLLRNFDTIPKKGINAEQWIKSQKNKYFFLGLIATLIAVFLIVVIYLSKNDNRISANLSLVGLTITTTDSFPQLDIKVRNNSDEVVLIKKMEVKTLGKWVIEYPQHPKFLGASWNYNIVLSDTIDKVSSFDLSQEIKPNSVDRFTIVVKGNTEPVFGLTPFLFSSKFFYNEDNKTMELPEVLVNIPVECNGYGSEESPMTPEEIKKFYRKIKASSKAVLSKVDKNVIIESTLLKSLTEIIKIDTTIINSH